MIELDLHIKQYGWILHIIAECDCSDNGYIVEQLQQIDCPDQLVREALDNLETCNYNIGLTYSNNKNKESVMVICKTSNQEQLINTFTHECFHFVQHLRISSEEEMATLIGNIMGKLWSFIRSILAKY